MSEDLLHYLWQYRLFNHTNLTTVSGQPVEIIQPGTLNRHSGPDFSNARIRVGETLWVGQVEIHLRTSDWQRHGHQHDPAYNNVVLHVVLHHDRDAAQLENGAAIPGTIELANRLPTEAVQRYNNFVNANTWVPCERQLHNIGALAMASWLDRLLVERLETKALRMRETLLQTRNDWAETFYRHLLRNFGFKVNAEPFIQLAEKLPLKVLRKHHNNLQQVEALLFGVAGMLDRTFGEDYPSALAREFNYLRKKYKLKTIDASAWKFARMRPANFPTVRLAQLAALLHQQPDLFATIRGTQSPDALLALFSGIRISGYWETHYRLDLPAAKKRKRLGVESARNLLINTVAPALFLYGQTHDQQAYKACSIELLEHLPAEQNSIIKRWRDLGVEAPTAARSQALLQLRSNYCAAKKCLSCNVGNQLLKKQVVDG